MSTLVNKSLFSLVLKSFGAIAQLLLALIIARLWGASASGEYFYFYTLVVVFSVIGRLGIDRTLVKYCSSFSVNDDWNSIRKIVTYSSKIIVLPTLVCGLVASVFLVDYNDLLSKGSSSLNLGFFWESLLLVFSVFLFSQNFVYSQSLFGLKIMAIPIGMQNIIIPVCVGSLAIVFRDSNPLYLILFFFLAVLFSLTSGYLYFKKLIRSHEQPIHSESKLDIESISKSRKSLHSVAICNIIIIHASILMLGLFESSNNVGIYNAVFRFAQLIEFPLISVNVVLSPKFSELFTKGEINKIFKLARKFSFYLILLVLPFALLLFAFPNLALSYFGPEFVAGAVPLQILVFAQLFVIFVGPSQAALVMTGNESMLSKATLISALTCIILGLFLIPQFGLIGAACTAAITRVLSCSISFFYFNKLRSRYT